MDGVTDTPGQPTGETTGETTFVPARHRIDASADPDRFSREALGWAEERGFVPPQLYVQIAKRCNLRCTMCGFAAWASNEGFMSPDTFAQVLDRCREDGIRKLVLVTAQGEPFLHPRVFDLLDMATGGGFEVLISTNGTPFTEAKLRRLARTPLAAIQFSFAGFDRQSYETIYDGAKFERVSENLRLLRRFMTEEGSRTSLTVHGIYADSVHHLCTEKEFVARTTAFLQSLGIPLSDIQIGIPHNFAGTVEAGAEQGGVCSHKDLSAASLVLCPILMNSPGVYHDGRITACGCLDSNGDLTIGSIRDGRISDARRGPAFQRLVQAFLDKDLSALPLCRKCDVPYSWGASRYVAPDQD